MQPKALQLHVLIESIFVCVIYNFGVDVQLNVDLAYNVGELQP